MIKQQYIVQKPEKLVKILQDFGLSYADSLKLLRKKDVKVNGKAVKDDVETKPGDEVIFFCSADMFSKKFEIVFENAHVLVIFKHVGIESVGMLEKVLGAIAVHRLDRNTQGLMVFAKDEPTAQKLQEAFKNHKVHKYYVAEVVGNFETNKTYEAFLLKDEKKALVSISEKKVKGALPISTSVKTLKAGSETSVLEIELHTGRTHQIRAHLAFLGHPILGDGKYGKNEINKKFKQNWQKLACFRLKFENIGVDGLDFATFEKYPKFMQDVCQ